MNTKLINKRDASLLLGVSVRTIERMFKHGQLTKVKVRGCVRARLCEIKELLGDEVPA